MTQAEFNFNLPSPAELFPHARKADGQNVRLYARFLVEIEIFNSEMRDKEDLLCYTKRISDIREALEPHGWTIKCHRRNGGKNSYKLERLEQIEREAA